MNSIVQPAPGSPIFLALAHIAQAMEILEREVARQEQVAGKVEHLVGAERHLHLVTPGIDQTEDDGTRGGRDGEAADDGGHG
jgi:hypothetical protein